MEPLRIIEAILFAANRPLSEEEIASLLKAGGDTSGILFDEASLAVDNIRRWLDEYGRNLEGSGMQLVAVAGGYRLATREDYAPWISAMFDEAKPPRLSGPALETLAVIAYRQPISRAEIEAVRGVAVGGVLETLVDRGVIRVAGRADVPGRPLIYETTPFFLEHFGLRDLNDLPNVEELKRVKLPDPPEPEAPQQPELLHESAGPTQEN
ncbi:MAG: SMC-Scp complex subunit ScpB [Blastochloris sp.]|nr:SMC-Scp complex subunit ScpB [Blastochloris sp.]